MNDKERYSRQFKKCLGLSGSRLVEIVMEHSIQAQLHQRGLKGGETSFIGRHVAEKHNRDYNVTFKMKVLSHHLSQCHQRQVAEAVMIREIGQDSLINTRGERGTDLVSEAANTITRSPPVV